MAFFTCTTSQSLSEIPCSASMALIPNKHRSALISLLGENVSEGTIAQLEGIFEAAVSQKVDAKIANGETIGLLEGIPFGIKDVYMVQGTYTTASSDLLRN